MSICSLKLDVRGNKFCDSSSLHLIDLTVYSFLSSYFVYNTFKDRFVNGLACADLPCYCKTRKHGNEVIEPN